MFDFSTRALLGGIAMLCAVGVVEGQTITLPPVDLTPVVRERIEKAACLRPLGVSAEAISGYKYPSGKLSARACCKSHDEYAGRRIFGEAQCENHGHRWKCEERWLNIEIDAPRLPQSVRLDAVSVEVATAILGYLETLPAYPGGVLRAADLRNIWRLEGGDDTTVTAFTSGAFWNIERKSSCGEYAYEITSSGLVDY